MILSSTDKVEVLKIVCVPSTVKFPLTLKSPTEGSSNLPVSPSRVIRVVVLPPSFTVNMISLSCVVCAIVKLSELKLKVISDPAPKVNPESFNIPNVPEVVSLAFDLKKFAAATPPSASESVEVPLNFADDTVVDNCIPCDTVENPAAINAAAFVSVEDGVNASEDTIKTTVSF